MGLPAKLRAGPFLQYVFELNVEGLGLGMAGVYACGVHAPQSTVEGLTFDGRVSRNVKLKSAEPARKADGAAKELAANSHSSTVGGNVQFQQIGVLPPKAAGNCGEAL